MQAWSPGKLRICFFFFVLPNSEKSTKKIPLIPTTRARRFCSAPSILINVWGVVAPHRTKSSCGGVVIEHLLRWLRLPLLRSKASFRCTSLYYVMSFGPPAENGLCSNPVTFSGWTLTLLFTFLSAQLRACEPYLQMKYCERRLAIEKKQMGRYWAARSVVY